MRLLIGLVLIAFVAVWWWLLPRRSGSRMWSPIWLAFTTTVAAAVFTVAGGIGYTLSRHTR